MNKSENFIKALEQYEHQDKELGKAELSWYRDLLQGVSAKGEIALKTELEGYYVDARRLSKKKVIQLWSAVGIAAVFVLGGLYMSNLVSKGNSIPLNTNTSPIYADSASYDTTKIKIEKKVEKDVDK